MYTKVLDVINLTSLFMPFQTNIVQVLKVNKHFIVCTGTVRENCDYMR